MIRPTPDGSGATSRLITELERDIRNQVLLDRMRTVTLKERTMIHLRDHGRTYLLCTAFYGALLVACAVAAHADPLSPDGSSATRPQCPTAGEKCKVLFLNENEENLLVGKNGILDTAAQARNLDLGQFAVYFKTKLATAPTGEVKPIEKPDDKK